MSAEILVILLVAAIYFGGLLYVGFKLSKTMHSLDDYILGGRNLPWFVLTLTFAATVANTATVMGQPGFAYSSGFTYVFWAALSATTIGIILLSRFGARLRAMNLTTISDLATARFGNSRRVEVLMSVWQVSWGIFIIGMSLFGVSLIIEVITGISWAYSIGPIAIVTILYTMTGGLKAVVLTDALQMLIIVLGITALFLMLTFQHGFFTNFMSDYVGGDGFTLSSTAEELTLFPGFTDLFTLPPEMTLFALIAYIIATSFWIPVDLGFVQRSLAAKSVKDSRSGVYSFFALDWFNAWILVLIGAYGAVLLPGLVNTDEVVIRLVQDTLPLIGAALVVTAVAAAAMSTISTYLNAGSGIIVHNILKKIKPAMTDRQQLKYTRVFTAVIGIVAIGFGPFISSNGIVIAAVGIQIILISTIVPLVFLALYWKKMTEKAAFWGCLITSTATIGMIIQVGGVWEAFAGSGFLDIPVILWGLLLAFTLYIGISLIDRTDGQSLMSNECKAMFANKETVDSNKDIIVLGGVWVGLFAIMLINRYSTEPTAFPPLSGPFSIVTDLIFIAISIAISIFAIYLVTKVVAHVKEEFFAKS
ncbi:sodium:solute symporter family protein [Geomicrobium sediminis]|uniref:SSS family solute:Na+ symporter n=1 Tax=Geomicrobium sediminis TaxID=1347788 RepID=A0ABS2PBV7_9BACL|nr:sodium:solute symporter family protein [Geomicrobium sediminis]MBM7632915.1 SSS family solute:Na+ symporter [Geomicrobium sediminis]